MTELDGMFIMVIGMVIGLLFILEGILIYALVKACEVEFKDDRSNNKRRRPREPRG